MLGYLALFFVLFRSLLKVIKAPFFTIFKFWALKMDSFTNHLMDNHLQPIAICDDKGVFLYCNSSYLGLVSKSSNQVIGFSMRSILPKQFLSLEIEAECLLMSSGEGIIQYQLSCNSLFPFEIKASIYKERVNDPLNDRRYVIKTIIHLNNDVGYCVMQYKFQYTSQEMRVFNGLVNGLSVKAIAINLKISPSTVSDHMKGIYAKTNIHSRYELQRIAHDFYSSPLSNWKRLLPIVVKDKISD